MSITCMYACFAASLSSSIALPSPTWSGSTNVPKGPRRSLLPIRIRRLFSSCVSRVAFRFSGLPDDDAREKTGGTAERCARIFVEVRARSENFGRVFRTMHIVIKGKLTSGLVYSADCDTDRTYFDHRRSHRLEKVHRPFSFGLQYCP